MDDQSLILRVRFYRTDSGREPVRDWLLGLEREARKTIGEDVKTVQFGWPLGMPLIRKIEAGLWEVRSTLNHGIARVLFTVTGSDMILLNGFVKKSQKAPQSEMALARKRLAEVRRASETMTMNDSIGSDFDDFLRDQGMLAEVEAVALKRLLTFQIEQEMKLHRMSRSDMARRIEANATSIDALLDPDDASVTLKMLEQAARAVGKTLKVELA